MSARKLPNWTSSANVMSTPIAATRPFPNASYARLVAPSAVEITASSTTADVSEAPSETRRCELWSRPPCVTGRPSSSLTTVTSVVSRIGTARTMIGRSSVANVDDATV